MATMYDPVHLEAMRVRLEYAVVAVVREALPSPLVIDSYASAMVACDEAEERDVEAGVLMELLWACQEVGHDVTDHWRCTVRVDIDNTRHYAEFQFVDAMPDRLLKAMQAAIDTNVEGCAISGDDMIAFRYRYGSILPTSP